MLVKSIIKY